MLVLGINLTNKIDYFRISEDILNENIDFSRLSNMEFSEYMEWFLPIVLEKSRNEKYHNTIVSIFRKYSKDFYEIYLSEIEKLLKRDKDKADDILISFIKYIEIESRSNRIESENLYKVSECIIKILSNLSDVRIIEFNDSIRKALFFQERALKFWDDIYAKFGAYRSKSIFGKFRGILFKN